jgi:hypothetical protein
MGSIGDRYDPSETDETRPKSSHISRRDIILVTLIIAIVMVFLVPVIKGMVENRNKYVCKDNFSKISTALLIYAEENTNRLPPLYVEQQGGGPAMFGGNINSWVTLIAPFVKEPKDRFRCPSASPEELVANEGPDGMTLMSSYGMFAGLASVPIDNVANQAQAALISESTTTGKRGTFNPMPLKAADGTPLPDGISIGFDNSNFPLDEDLNTLSQATLATRLAFYDAPNGDFKKDGASRHPSGIHVLFLDRHVETVKPRFGRLQRIGKSGEILPPWAVPVLGDNRTRN